MNLEKLDHPLLFLLFMLLALKGMEAVINWGAQSFGFTGLAALFKNP